MFKFWSGTTRLRLIVSTEDCFEPLWSQPRPQGLLLVQNGGRRNPWPKLLKYSKNRRVFCHVTHGEMALSEVGFSIWWPCLFFFFCNLKPLFKRTEVISKRLRDKILTNFWIHVAALARGFSDRNFERGEGPGDEVVMKSLCTHAPWV